MNRIAQTSAARLLALCLAVFLAGSGLAGSLKKVRPAANPPQYRAFSILLSAQDRDLHALERLTFGPQPGDLDRIHTIGLGKWLDQQLHPEQVPENPDLIERLKPLESVLDEPRSADPPNQVIQALSQAKLLRAIYSNHQFQELLVDFWFNHFNVFWGKGQDRFFLPAYERDVIRPHVFGKFYDLLLATAESPAMLFYLDNWQSVGPDSIAALRARGRVRRGLNENYGRELMELHTLGVDGGYTQQDVIEVARCFTGWTIQNPRQGGAFQYNDRMHDKGRKVVLGHVIPAGGGMEDGIEVLKILARSPATAHHISFELAQRFVADDPPPSLVNRMAETFLKTDGDLRRVLETMLGSGEFWSQGAWRAKVKSPFEMIASAVRVTGAGVTSALTLAQASARLGEPLYRKIEPVGYPNVNREWISSSGLLDRMNFALALVHNRVPGVHVDAVAWNQAPPDPRRLEEFLLGHDASPATNAAIETALQQIPAAAPPAQTLALAAALTLGSPDFQRK